VLSEFGDQPQTFERQKTAQGLARMVGACPDAGRNRYVCSNAGRLGGSALKNRITIQTIRQKYPNNAPGLLADIFPMIDVCLHRLLQSRAATRLAVVLAAVFLLAVSVKAADQKSPEPPKTTAASPPSVIPVEDIAAQATAVGNLIRGFATNLAPDKEIETIREIAPQLDVDIDLDLKSTTNILKEQPSLEALEAQQQIWQQRQLQLTAWLNVLTRRATRLQVALNQLKTLHDTWARTRDAEQSAKAPPAILKQIDATLATIEAAQEPHQAERDGVLNLQSKIAELIASCNTALAQIAGLQQRVVGGIFTREGTPIWKPELWPRAEATLADHLPQIVASYWRDILLYVRDPSRHMPRHVVMFLVLSLVLLAARRHVGPVETAGGRPLHGTAVFDHPFAAALLVTLIIATAPASPVPVTVKRLFEIAGLVPIIILTRRSLPPTVTPVIYALAILFATDSVRQAVTGDPPISQAMLVLEAVAGIVVLVWLWFYGAYREARGLGQTSTLRRSLAAITLFILAIGLLAAAAGYMRLARLAIPGVFVGGALAMELYASVHVAMGVIGYALRVWPLRLLHMVQNHRDLLERRIYRFFLWLAVFAWLSRYLDYVGLFDPASSLFQAFFNTRLERGSISTSVGDIVAFFLTLSIAYLLSAFIRFVLEEDVYSRTRIATGQSYAVSSLLNYFILAIGFILALGVLGLDLNKVTVLLGAFGVGIGFGLQSVVNNFVSGLILLFERPIHLGDTVQVGEFQGRVRRIGIRASIVRTAQGAEIIVPNAQLITQNVTNWTLSDRLRRIDLPVAVIAGAAPKKVIELIETVARAHPQILHDPAPHCLFMSYGDSSINFELRAWTEYTNSVQVHSDLTVAIYEAVNAAGLSFPFPQREARLLSDYNGESTNASMKAADKKT
jgi:potassium-dependent mechanosensitive channel